MRAYLILLILDILCWIGIWMLIREHPNAAWVMGLVVVYGYANWFRSRAKDDDDE